MEIRRLLDALDLLQHLGADIDQIRGAFAEDVEADRRVPIEAACVIEAFRPETNRRDITEPQALRIQRNRSDIVETGPLSLRLNAKTRTARTHLPCRDRKV